MWVYIRVEPQPITTAWIYHNTTLGLISLSSDWSNWITIADKNLWATQVRNDWDTLSEANCGKYYQWGNNYGFPRTWGIRYSSTIPDLSNYWPDNYYSSNYFVRWASWISSVYNDNLWGWATWTVEAMQWPCDTWFHVPSYTELSNLVGVVNSLSLWELPQKYLKLPYAWCRNTQGAIAYQWTEWDLWASTSSSSDSAWWLSNTSNVFIAYDNKAVPNWWYTIRPFKNEAVQPDSSRTVLYQPD